MLSGFNTNVRHKGAVFHVQTEDSGRNKPHVITHLFHGGNILASEKQGYEHLLQEGELEPQVKRMMEEQHGAMLARLKSGELDELIRARLDPEASQDRTQVPHAPARSDATAPPARARSDATAPPARARSDATAPPARARSDATAPPASPPRPATPAQAAAPRPRPAAPAATPAPAPERQRPLDEVVLDYLLESARQRKKR